MIVRRGNDRLAAVCCGHKIDTAVIVNPNGRVAPDTRSTRSRDSSIMHRPSTAVVFRNDGHLIIMAVWIRHIDRAVGRRYFNVAMAARVVATGTVIEDRD